MKESLAAKRTALDVLETIGNGEIPNVTKIAIKNGYSPSSATSGIVQKTKSYQSIVKPFADKLAEERERAIDALKGRIGKAKYRDLVDAIDKLTKNHQLLTGGSTENIAVQGVEITVRK